MIVQLIAIFFVPVCAATAGLVIWIIGLGQSLSDDDLIRHFLVALTTCGLILFGISKTDTVRIRIDPEFRTQTELEAGPLGAHAKEAAEFAQRTAIAQRTKEAAELAQRAEEAAKLARRAEMARIDAECARQADIAGQTPTPASTSGLGNRAPRPRGPSRVVAFNLCGTLLFVAADNGVFKFHDGVWADASIRTGAHASSKRTATVSTMAVDADNTLYAGTFTAGIFKSGDDGKTWTDANDGLDTTNINTLMLGPGNTLYAGTYTGLFVRRDGIWQAIDPGTTLVFNHGPKYPVHSLAIGPDGSLVAGTPYGIYKRGADGAWTISSKEATAMYAMACDSKGTLYAAGEAGVYMSLDGGSQWSQTLGYVAAKSLAIDSHDNIYVGGTGFKNISPGVVTTFGVLSQKSPGGEWTPINETMKNHTGDSESVMSLAVKRDGTLIAGAYAGVFQRAKDNRSWLSLAD